MSRYELRPLPEFVGHEIAVGWDGFNGTLFAYVIDRSGGESVDLLNVGQGKGDITDPRVVVELLRGYAQIPQWLAEKLAADLAAGGNRADRRLDALDGG